MFLFGHLGIGNTLAAPFRRGLPKRWILLGTLAPDLLDKVLYYGLSLVTGRSGAELGLISGTRTFGHTAIFLLALSLISLARKSRILAALSLGIATHLLLDGIAETYSARQQISALFWPFTGLQFPIHPFADAAEHLGTWNQPLILGAEVVGILLLGWDAWKLRHRHEIREFFKERRISLRKLRERRRLRKAAKR